VKQLLNSKDNGRRGLPEGFALIGLIPMGVGLALIVYYPGETNKPQA
jgi:hypothetical protein